MMGTDSPGPRSRGGTRSSSTRAPASAIREGRMSPRSYKTTLAILGLVSLLLVPFLVQGALPAMYGTVALVVVVAWLLYGVVSSKLTRRSGHS